MNLHKRALSLEVGHEGLALQLVDQLVEVDCLTSGLDCLI